MKTSNIIFAEQDVQIPVDFASVETRTIIEKDYKKLINKPSFNGIELDGDLSNLDLSVALIYRKTEAEWNAQPTLISQEGAFYVYSDHKQVTDADGNITNIPAIKIGDGVSFLTSLPFIGGGSYDESSEELEEIAETVEEHIADSAIHVSDEDRSCWNGKVEARIDDENPEKLVIF